MRIRSTTAALALSVALISAQDQPTSITSHIPRQQVDSSVIEEVGYSKRRHWLELKFANGSIYRYVDVPPSVYRELITAESKAGYYTHYVRSNYRSIRVRPRVKDKAIP